MTHLCTDLHDLYRDITSSIALCFELTFNTFPTLNKLPCTSTKAQSVSGQSSSPPSTITQHAEPTLDQYVLIKCLIRDYRVQTLYSTVQSSPILPWRQLILYLMGLYLIALCNGVIGLATYSSAGGSFGHTLMIHFIKSPFLRAF